MKTQKEKISLTLDIRKDFLWWFSYMEVFNGVQFLVPDSISIQIAGDACVIGMGSYNPNDNSYFSTKFPLYLQDPSIQIHLKESVCVIIAVKFWGPSWAGKRVAIFCDNDSVCDVITNLKPKNHNMQAYLREFFYWVCKYNFHPILSKISSGENDIADFLSRNSLTLTLSLSSQKRT